METVPMSIDSRWDNPQHTVILTTYSREWTWDEFREHESHEIGMMLESVSHPIVILSDMRNTHWLPQERFMERIREITNRRQQHPVAAVVFIVNDHAVATLLVQAFARYGPADRHYTHAQTLEEARTLAVEMLNAYT
jgi:hypothetical protein